MAALDEELDTNPAQAVSWQAAVALGAAAASRPFPAGKGLART